MIDIPDDLKPDNMTLEELRLLRRDVGPFGLITLYRILEDQQPTEPYPPPDSQKGIRTQWYDFIHWLQKMKGPFGPSG